MAAGGMTPEDRASDNDGGSGTRGDDGVGYGGGS